MAEQALYKKYADLYDKIYWRKDYVGEAKFILDTLHKYKVPGRDILDMACGTAQHSYYLAKQDCRILGVDPNPAMLKIARKKVRRAEFRTGLMQTFKSKQKFDAVLCLFTAINYVSGLKELEQTFKNFYELLKPGGVVIFDAGLVRGRWHPTGKYFRADRYRKGDYEITRYSQWNPESGNVHKAKAVFWMFVGEMDKMESELDEHYLSSFSVAEYLAALRKAGFQVNVYGEFKMQRYGPKHRRPVFVARKQP